MCGDGLTKVGTEVLRRDTGVKVSAISPSTRASPESSATRPRPCTNTAAPALVVILPRAALNRMQTVQRNSRENLPVGSLRDRIGHRARKLTGA